MRKNKSVLLATTIALIMIVPVLFVIVPSVVGGVSVSSYAPASGAVLEGSYTFSCNTSADGTAVSLYIDGVFTATMADTGGDNYQYTIDTSGYNDGNHIIRYDITGSSSPTSVTMSVPCKFDNSGPSITNVSTFYPKGQTHAKPGDQVTIRAEIEETISSLTGVVCDASKIGGTSNEKMYDDGLHNDGSPDDGFFGTDALTINSTGGYWATYILATDRMGNVRNKTAGVDVDIYEPTILDIQTQLPAGQTAVKNGDQIRITGKALDYKILIEDVVERQPLDVVLVLDNSGSMSGTPWTDLKLAAKQFIENLTEQDRCAIYAFDAQSGSPWESVKQYAYFMYMNNTYTDPNGGGYTNTGENVLKHIIDTDSANHLTRYFGAFWGWRPGCNTPIWDSIGTSISYAELNRRTDAVPIVIAMTDGDDYASGSERGSETYCPGGQNGLTALTWAASGGNEWGSTPVHYGTVNREFDTSTVNGLTAVTPGGTVADRTRTGLVNASLPVFTIGLGIDPQGSDNTAAGYLAKSAWSYNYTTEFDLNNIANSSAGGRYYFAPDSDDLSDVYTNVSEVIEKFGVSTLGLEQPNGIATVQADLSSIGISLMVNMFDDGLHGDGKAGDDIYGSDWVTVNSLETGTIIFDVEGTDLAGNSNGTHFSVKLDNQQPTVHWANTSYPAGRDKAQDGYQIFVTTNATDLHSGLADVYLDATNIGGGTQVVMNDEGTGNDVQAHDGIYTSDNVTVATGQATGVFTYTVNAYDRSGNIGSLSGNVDIYNDVDIIFWNLINGQTLTDDFDLQMNITDPDGIPDTSVNPRYRIDANQWMDMDLLSGSIFNATIDTTGYLDGPHTLYVNAKDIYGAETTESMSIVIDNTAPTQCTIIAPIANQYVEGVYSFKTTALDALEIGNVTITIHNQDTGADEVDNGTMGYNTGTGYYEFVLGSATIPDGNYTVKCFARDKAGHELVSSATKFKIDNDDPVMTINSPINGQTIFGKWTMNLNVADVFLDEVEYNVDSSGWVDVSTVLNTYVLADGTHSIKFRATDLSGHTVEETITVTVDNNFPTGAMASPSASQYVSGIHTIRVTAFDQVGIDTVNLTLRNRDTVTIISMPEAAYNSGTGYFEYLFDTTAQADGNYSVQAYVEDDSGNVTITGILNFQIDNIDPVLNIISPADGQIIFGTWVMNIKASDVFIDKIQYNVDSAGWVDSTTNLDTTALSDGSHSIRIKATDLGGHTVEETISVTVDNTNPVGTIASPSKDQFLEGIHSFRVSASDAVGIQRVNLTIYDNDTMSYLTMPEAGYNSGTGYYEYLMDSTSHVDGNYSVWAFITDVSGYQIVTPVVEFHIDNNIPDITINYPKDGDMVWGNVTFNLTMDNEPFVSSIQYNIDDGGWVDVTTEWNTTLETDGYHDVELRVTDLAGHVKTVQITVIVDNNGPAGSIANPGTDGFVEGYFTFKIAATDQVGIASVVITVFNTTYNTTYNTQSSTYDLSLDTRVFADGDYNITVNVTDLAGWWVILSTRNFSIDNNAPEVTIDTPLGNSYVSDYVSFAVTVDELYPGKVEYNIDNKGWVNLTTLWNTSKETDGAHDVQVRAYDLAGHVTTAGVTVIVDNTDPLGDIAKPGLNQYLSGVYTFGIMAMDSVGVGQVIINAFGENFNATYDTQSSLWSATVDTSLYEDGTYLLSATIIDLAGRTIYVGPRTYMVDNTYPILSINNPANGQFVEGIVDINVTVVEYFPDVTEYNVDSKGWVQIDTPWDTTDLKEGEHTIDIRTIDKTGRTTSYSIFVVVDNIAPTCEIHSPAPSQFVEGDTVFKIKATDEVGIAYVLIEYEGAFYNATLNTQTGYYEYTIDTTLQIEDGEVSISATTYDLSGKTTSDGPINFFIDNQPPILTIFYPSTGDFVEGLVYINATSQDEFQIPTEYNVDGAGWKQVGIGWDTTKVADGEHTVQIRARDIIGHQTIETLTVIVDNSVPTCSIHYPVAGQFLEGVATFKVQATDPLMIDRVEVEVFGQTVVATYNTVTNYYEYSHSLTKLLDGSYTLYATAYDLSGKSSRVGPVVFYIDSHDPIIDVESPNNGEYLFGIIFMNVTVIDAFNYTVEYSVDKGGYTMIETPLSTQHYRDGLHEIEIRATDEAGHSTTRIINVYIDNSQPEISLVSPVLNETVNGVTMIKAYCTDSLELDRVIVTIDDGFPIEIFLNPSTGLYEHPWDTTGLDGLHTITVTAYDHVGQQRPITVSVWVDNSLQGLTVLPPMETSGQITFQAQVASTEEIQGVFINIDGTGYNQMTPDANGTYVYIWTTDIEDNGDHVYQVKAVDKFGNEDVSTGTITVDNEEETDYGGIYSRYVIPTFALVLIIIVILLIAFFIFLFIWTGKAKEMIVKEEKPPETEGEAPAEAPEDETQEEEDLEEIFGTDEAPDGEEAEAEPQAEDDDITEAEWEDDDLDESDDPSDLSGRYPQEEELEPETETAAAADIEFEPETDTAEAAEEPAAEEPKPKKKGKKKKGKKGKKGKKKAPKEEFVE